MAAPRKKAPAKKASPAKKAAAKKTPAKRAPAKKAAPAKRSPTKKAAASPTPAVSDQDRQVLDLRRAGVSFSQIATQMKAASLDDVYAAYGRALEETMPPLAGDVQRIELDRLERMMTPLWPKAMRGEQAAIAEIASLSAKRMQIARHAHAPADQEKGPVELATIAEVALLGMSEHTLAAAALVMARLVDRTQDNTVAAATAARELRQTMTNLRNLAGAAGDRSGEDKPGKGDVVVPESRLQAARRQAAARGATSKG